MFSFTVVSMEVPFHFFGSMTEIARHFIHACVIQMFSGNVKVLDPLGRLVPFSVRTAIWISVVVVAFASAGPS